MKYRLVVRATRTLLLLLALAVGSSSSRASPVRVMVFVNPFAGKGVSQQKLSTLGKIVGSRGEVIRIGDRSAYRSALDQVASAPEQHHVTIFGGDGSLTGILGELHLLAPGSLPKLYGWTPLKGGTTNLAPRNLHRFGLNRDAELVLRQIISAYEKGRPLGKHKSLLLGVNDRHFGQIFLGGTAATLMSMNPKHSLGPQWLHALAMMLRRDPRIRPLPAKVAHGNGPAKPTEISMALGGTGIRKWAPGFRPVPLASDETMHVVTTSLPIPKLLLHARSIATGKPLSNDPAHYFSGALDRLEMTFEQPTAYFVNGEPFEAKVVVLRRGPTLDLVYPAGD